ncbi:MAG: hypothetical protein M1150_01840 [Patescibacteria group bacterium]|nr:hypothetical protein [Patescibacteria group bacterium]
MIAPLIKRVTKGEKISIVRKILEKEQAKVVVGDIVSPEDVVGLAEVSAGQRLVKISSCLKVNGKGLEKYLTKPLGEKVFRGEILASRKSIFGLKKSVCLSPIDGILSEIDAAGNAVLKFLPTQTRVVAGVPGKVSDVSKESVVIEALVARIRTKIGTGKEREGAIKVVASASEFLLPVNIDGSCRDKIIIGGAFIGKDALEKALTLGVRGVVAGGINLRNFLSLGELDAGITVLITEGFGIRPMAEDVFNLLKEHEDTFSIINGAERYLTLPEVKEPKGKVEKEAEKDLWRELKVGDRVHILGEHHGHLGIVKEIEKETFYSFYVPEVMVELNGKETLKVPACNLEIIDED